MKGSSYTNQYRYMLDAWHPVRNPESNIPGAYRSDELPSSNMVYDASYIRLKNIQLGYTLPANLVKKAGMTSVRVYVSADNLLTISDISGMFDPEALYDGSGYGGNGKMYPLQKTISVGLNVNF